MFKFNIAKKQPKHEGKIRDVLVGRVYKIFNSEDNFIYIGSTTVTLTKRWGSHMTELNKHEKYYKSEDITFKNNIPISNLYKHMMKLGRDKFIIELIDIKIVDSTNELKEMEQSHINIYNQNILLNMIRSNINEYPKAT